MYSLKVAPSFSRSKVKCFLLRFANDLEDYAKVDQMPILEGKRMTIQLSPKKKEAPKKSATAGAPKPAAPAQKQRSRKRAKNKKGCVTRRYSALPLYI